jgi:micrococcal nuclease
MKVLKEHPWLLLVALTGFALIIYSHDPWLQPDLPTDTRISRIIDGDTIVIHGGIHVRLIGIDTPETVHPQKPVERFGREATEYTKERLPYGTRITLSYDQANAHRGHRDRYGRLLAYVKRRWDGLDFNAQIVRDGYAHVETHYPFARKYEFKKYQNEAREAGRGLWAN